MSWSDIKLDCEEQKGVSTITRFTTSLQGSSGIVRVSTLWASKLRSEHQHHNQYTFSDIMDMPVILQISSSNVSILSTPPSRRTNVAKLIFIILTSQSVKRALSSVGIVSTKTWRMVLTSLLATAIVSRCSGDPTDDGDPLFDRSLSDARRWSMPILRQRNGPGSIARAVARED